MLLVFPIWALVYFAGTAVNDTSSVTATAAVWDSMKGTGTQVLEYGTIVKLTRTPCNYSYLFRFSKLPSI